MFCKTCQTHLSQDALSCPACDTPVTEEERQQSTGSDTILRSTDIHYESDLPTDENDISSIIDVHHKPTTPIVADVYHEEEVLTSIEAQDERKILSDKVTFFSNEDTEHETAATELHTVQDIPPQDILTNEDTALDHETVTELQVPNISSNEDIDLEATEAHTVHDGSSNEDTVQEATATEPQTVQDGSPNEATVTELPTIQDMPPLHNEQHFNEYTFVQEPPVAAMPVTQTDIPVPQLAQAGTKQPALSPPASIYQPPSPRKPRQRDLLLLILALIGLGLILLIENGGVIFFATAYQPALVHAQATAQAHKLATAQVNATSISQLQATAQAQASSESLKINLAQAQTGNPGVLYTMATSGKPTLDASSPTKSNSVCDGFNGGTFHVLNTTKNTFSTCYSTSGNDFVFQIQMNINTGDDGGLLFRSNSDYSSGYYLRFDQKGYYEAFSRTSGSGQWLQSSFIPGFKTGNNQTNLITVIALGDNFYLYSNTQFIGQIKDNTYSSGRIELIADNIQATSTDVVYSGAEFWDLS